ncbi:hypothetical protein [Wielerella bovis]|uniref:hypothetical protein n=1 Tax=Wielerella bovis TaxID=2917790 RepID=UPI0020195E25|nr:hypothetical protein [Wielerella bovis]ULJ65430.1 hypothetical protein MIS33_03950 [Wielerella bovis]ULJ67775.1 hypothetical protein MIS31_04315 [Wielerella bovis]
MQETSSLKQQCVDFYNKTESWVSGLFFLFYGFRITDIYQRYEINKKQSSINIQNFFRENMLEIAILIVAFFICLIIAIWLKSNKSTAELQLEHKLEQKEIKIQELENDLSTLKNELEEAQIAITGIREENLNDLFNLSSQFLRLLALKFEFSHHERISLYLHDSVNNYFTLLARFSKNTRYCKKHRKTFPDEQGVLGAAWHGRHSFYEIYTLPNPKSTTALKKWTELKMPEETIENLSMKSNELIVFPILHNQNNIGVILIESVRKSERPKNSDEYMTENKKLFENTIKECNTFLVELANCFMLHQNKLNDCAEGFENE